MCSAEVWQGWRLQGKRGFSPVSRHPASEKATAGQEPGRATEHLGGDLFPECVALSSTGTSDNLLQCWAVTKRPQALLFPIGPVPSPASILLHRAQQRGIGESLGLDALLRTPVPWGSKAVDSEGDTAFPLPSGFPRLEASSPKAVGLGGGGHFQESLTLRQNRHSYAEPSISRP